MEGAKEWTVLSPCESLLLRVNNNNADNALDDTFPDISEFIYEGSTASAYDPALSTELFTQSPLMFNEPPSMSSLSSWHSISSTTSSDNVVSNVSETTHTACAYQLNETSEGKQESVSKEKQELTDLLLQMDSMLAPEQPRYIQYQSTPAEINHTDLFLHADSMLDPEQPRYIQYQSTPAEEINHTFTHHTTETESSPNSNRKEKYQKINLNSLLKQSQNAKRSANSNVNSANSKVNKPQLSMPPYSYVAMVIVAILTSEEKQLTLSEIHKKLMDMFPFFRGEYTGWKNSIRDALRQSKCFDRVEKCDKIYSRPVFLWKVNTKYVRPDITFNRTLPLEDYKLTLQEELGLPPYDCTPENDTLNNNNITLPTKPCLQTESLSLAGSVSGGVLNVRNDSIPSPHSTISDSFLRISPSVTDIEQTTYESRMQQVAMTQFGNLPQTSAQPSTLGCHNDILALRQWLFSQASYYNWLALSLPLTYNTNSCDLFPSAALDLRKHKVEEK
ncbi:forkhead box protein J3-like isoform X2 [Mercenaria mercenaria]|nr:forkhead box protein J3-like isoform X2 [Mercenaria mercenaria]